LIVLVGNSPRADEFCANGFGFRLLLDSAGDLVYDGGLVRRYRVVLGIRI
jgi:hypothetical protein